MCNRRIVDCSKCMGDGGWENVLGLDRTTGSLLTAWEPCHRCGGSGEEEIEAEPAGIEHTEV